MLQALAVATTCWGLVMALAPLLQIRAIVRERDAGGTSPAWVCILLIGFLLWLAYGLVNQSLPLIITNVASVLVTAGLLATIALYRRRGRSVPSTQTTTEPEARS